MEKDPQSPKSYRKGMEDCKDLLVFDLLACLVNGLMCTDMCKLKDCDNRPSDDDINQPDTDEEDEDYN